MIETTLLKKDEFLGPNRSKIFDDDILEFIRVTDVAVCTGIWFFPLFKPGRSECYRDNSPILFEEDITPYNSVEELRPNEKKGVYPCFRFSDTSELIEDLGVRELKDYKKGIKRGVIYIPTNGTNRVENKKLLKKLDTEELKEIDINEAFFPTNKFNSLDDRIYKKYGIEKNKYYVDKNGEVYVLVMVNPIYDDRFRNGRMCALSNDYYVPHEETILAKVKPRYLYVDPEKKIAAPDVIPVSGIGDKFAIEQYLPVLTQSISDLQKVVQREQAIVEGQRNKEQMERIEKDRIRREQLVKNIEGLIRMLEESQQNRGNDGLEGSGDNSGIDGRI